MINLPIIVYSWVRPHNNKIPGFDLRRYVYETQVPCCYFSSNLLMARILPIQLHNHDLKPIYIIGKIGRWALDSDEENQCPFAHSDSWPVERSDFTFK